MTDQVAVADLDDRDRRALTEAMTVLPTKPSVGIYRVVGQHGNGEYTVDIFEGRETCTCPDHRYRDARCKHIRRVQFATGERAIPATASLGRVDDLLGAHVDGEPEIAVGDGGTQAGQGGDDRGPIYTYHREPPHVGGARYVRCERCGAESVPADPDRILHDPTCSEAADWRGR